MARSSLGVRVVVGDTSVLARICEKSVVYRGKRISHKRFTKHLVEILLWGETIGRGHYNLINGKLNGLDWMALRMQDGSRPMILRAPSISRSALIHIERSHENPSEFLLRLVEPQSSQRSVPIALTEHEVAAVAGTFGASIRPSGTADIQSARS